MNVADEPRGAVTCEPAALPADVARPVVFADLLPALLDEAAAQYEARVSGRILGPATGLPKLDSALAGRLVPGLHVLHGNTGSGKTAFALQTAALCSAPCLYITAEMAPLELARRVIARAAGVFLGRLKSGEFTRDEFAKHAAIAAAACPQLALLDCTQAYATAEQITAAAAGLRDRFGAEHVLIVIDSLHAWAGASPTFAAFGEYEALGVAVAELQRMAGTLKAPVLVLTERNRASADAGGVNAAAGSRKVEYGAETVLGLHRETVKADGKDRPKDFDSSGQVNTWVQLEKNRHGAGGRVDLRFHGALQRFTEGKA